MTTTTPPTPEATSAAVAVEQDPRAGVGRDVAGLALVIAVALVPRLLALAADPPGDLEYYFLMDEGLWAYNARQYALFGRWIMDDHNPPVHVAPLYTAALAGVYRWLGVGLAQTRLLSAAAGALACGLLYLAVRVTHPRRVALGCGLGLAGSYFMLSHNRVALVESLQLLFVVAMVAGALAGTRRLGWAALGGVAFALALLAKPSAAAMVPVLLGFWWAHRLGSRRWGLPPFSPRQPATFAVAAGAVLAIGLLAMVALGWGSAFGQLRASLITAYGQQNESPRYHPPGWDGIGLVVSRFFVQEAPILAVVLIYLLARLTGAAARRPSLTELLCWSWLVLGLGFIALQQYQPDRRFLILVPPAVVLAVLAVSERGLLLPRRTDRSARLTRLALAGAVPGGAVAFLLAPWIAPRLAAVVGGGLAPEEAGGAASLAGAALGALAMVLAGPRLPPTPRRVPLWPFLLGFLALEPGRYLRHLATPTYSIRDAGRDLGGVLAAWPAGRRVITGYMAPTLALEAKVFAFTVRYNWRNGARMNLDGWERFRPVAALVEPSRPASGTNEQIARRGFELCRRYAIWPDRNGRPRSDLRLYVEPGRCPAGPAQPARAADTARATSRDTKPS